MACMSVYFALAALHPALLIGGILIGIWVRLFFNKYHYEIVNDLIRHIDGS